MRELSKIVSYFKDNTFITITSVRNATFPTAEKDAIAFMRKKAKDALEIHYGCSDPITNEEDLKAIAGYCLLLKYEDKVVKFATSHIKLEETDGRDIFDNFSDGNMEQNLKILFSVSPEKREENRKEAGIKLGFIENLEAFLIEGDKSISKKYLARILNEYISFYGEGNSENLKSKVLTEIALELGGEESEKAREIFICLYEMLPDILWKGDKIKPRSFSEDIKWDNIFTNICEKIVSFYDGKKVSPKELALDIQTIAYTASYACNTRETLSKIKKGLEKIGTPNEKVEMIHQNLSNIFSPKGGGKDIFWIGKNEEVNKLAAALKEQAIKLATPEQGQQMKQATQEHENRIINGTYLG